jgi:hypothetical protein
MNENKTEAGALLEHIFVCNVGAGETGEVPTKKSKRAQK